MLVSNEGFNGLVIKIELRGIEIEKETDTEVILKVSSGEVWDEVVAYAVEKQWWGIENLSHIPGLTGAIAVQNVGAYGQEASQVVRSLEVYDMQKKALAVIPGDSCGFRYRQSIFNNESQGRYIILNTVFKLSKIPAPNLTYADVSTYFENRDRDPTIKQIRDAIIQIRDRKFTLPTITPNAGSFFKNLMISKDQYEDLENHIKTNFDAKAVEKLASFKTRTASGQPIKISTAFLIEICGLKGKVHGNVKVNETQPLVILNHTGKAQATEVLELMHTIRKTVYEKTGLIINPEPEFIGFEQKQLDEYMKLN